MERSAEPEVIDERFALLINCWRCRLFASHHLSSLIEYPRISNTPPSDAHGVDTRVLDHGEDVAYLENVAASKDDSVGVSLDQIGQERPV